jgi:hypothetical protein
LPVRSRFSGWAVKRAIAWTAMSATLVTTVPGWGASLVPPPPEPQPSQLYNAPPSQLNITAPPTSTSTVITTTEQTPNDPDVILFKDKRENVYTGRSDRKGIASPTGLNLKKIRDSADQKIDQSKQRVHDVNGKKRHEIENNKQHAQDTHDKIQQIIDRSKQHPKDKQLLLLY